MTGRLNKNGKYCLDMMLKWSWRFLVGTALLFVFYVLTQIFLFTSFSIPSDSMCPLLQPGDNVLVNKCYAGARLFSLEDAIDHKPLHIRRMPGTSDILHNDVVIFNFPYPERWDSIGFDVMLYYAKRCIALPGDTLEIKNGHYRVSGYSGSLGNIESQDELARIMSTEQGVQWLIKQNCYYAYPFDSLLNWNIKELGPLYIPRAGDQIHLEHSSVVLYRQLIEWEQGAKLTEQKGCYQLGGNEITNYTFQKNYYFMGGDKTENSRDSRYWGLLPEEYIVGKVLRIWKSIDKSTGTTRWERIWKKIG